MAELTGKGLAMVEAVDYVRTSNKNGVDVDQFDKAMMATSEFAAERFPNNPIVDNVVAFIPRNPEFFGDEKDKYRTAVANINIYFDELAMTKTQQVSNQPVTNVVNISDLRQVPKVAGVVVEQEPIAVGNDFVRTR